MIIDVLSKVLADLRQSNLQSSRDIDTISKANTEAVRLVYQKDWSPSDILIADLILRISNILYNNTDGVILLLEDGVYDLLLEAYKRYDANYQIGAEPIRFDMSDQLITKKETSGALPFTIVEDFDKMLYYDDLVKYRSKFKLSSCPPFYIDDGSKNLSIRNMKHNYPELVGTLDKCKFVCNFQAKDHGVFDEPNVKVLERDFLAPHIGMGLYRGDDEIVLIAELKYDGISVECTIEDGVIKEARSRGDTGEDQATDLTHLLSGYTFPNALEAGLKGTFGMQFEAIVLKPYLTLLSQMGLNYVNARNAVIGLSGRLDAQRYSHLITLVPLKTSMMDPDEPDKHLDRLVEIEFMNTYFAREVDLKYSVIKGDLASALFQVYKFSQEAEYMRDFLPFMYDGIVVSYYDENIRQKLGRKNFVNKYSMAVKFAPLKRMTTFLGYTFTIGQAGTVTPMIHYAPVEFYGTIHPKSTGHSYARFMELGLRVGDILEVEYTHDVMPYPSKPDIEANRNNPNPLIPFITNCPSCGAPIEISKSGKSARCPNPGCPARSTARLTNMIAKLDLKDFSEAAILELQEHLKVTQLADLFVLKREDVLFLGEGNSQKFIDRIIELQTKEIYDFKIIGSLGFSTIAKSKWKLILNVIPLHDIMYLDDEVLRQELVKIKGIGKMAAETITEERHYFMKDLELIIMMPNVKQSLGMRFGKKIRFTGVRDKNLIEQLNELGHDAGEGSVTEDTDILIVPMAGHTSAKTKKAGPNTVIIPLSDFVDNMTEYLG